MRYNLQYLLHTLFATCTGFFTTMCYLKFRTQKTRSAKLHSHRMFMSHKLLSEVKSRLLLPLPVPQPFADQSICLILPSALQYDIQSACLYAFHSHNILNLQQQKLSRTRRPTHCRAAAIMAPCV